MKRYVYAVFLLIFLYFLFFSIFRINDCDEGYILTASMRILNGELPYKDFFLHTPPLTYYAVAAVFKIFGQQLIAGRILTVIIGLLIALLLYLISRRIMSLAYALIPPLIFMSWGTGQVNIPSFAWFGLLFALGSVYAFIAFMDHEDSWSMMIAGIFSGLSFLSKQNLGLCTLAVFMIFLIINRARLKNLLLLTIFFIIPILAASYLFYIKGALAQFIKYVFFIGAESGIRRMQIFPYPGIQFPQVIMAAVYCAFFYLTIRRLRKKKTAFPFNILMGIFLLLVIFTVVFERTLPHFNRFLDYVKTGAIRGFFDFLVFSCIISIVLSVMAIRKKRREGCKTEMAVFFLSIFALLYIWAGLFISRDMLHHIYSLPPAFILAGYIFYRLGSRLSDKADRGIYSNYAIVFPVIFILVLGFVTNLNNEVFRDSEMPLYKLQSTVKLERAKFILTDAEYAKDITGLVNFLDAETAEKEKIFYTYFPDSEIFFLADRMPASFFHFIYSDTVRAGDEVRIINDIVRDRTRMIFLPAYQFVAIEKLPGPSGNGNVYDLERYIKANYALKKSFGRFIVLERSDG